MADQSDVETALVTLVADALYPEGCDAASVVGGDCRVYRGWPNPAALDVDLAAGRVNVTVFPQGEIGKNTTRYTERWVSSGQPTTLTAEVSGNSVFIGGTTEPGQVVGLMADGRTYIYRSQSGDTPAVVAANLAQLARADWIVQLFGSTFTISGASAVLARVVADVPALQEVRRQEQTIRITCWCPTPGSRDTVAGTIDQLLSTQRFIDLSDGTKGRLIYCGSAVFDQSQDALLYRRDLLYKAEYPTTITALQPAMLFGDLILNAAHYAA